MQRIINLLNKIWFLLTVEQRKNTIILLILVLTGTFLETLGIGMVIPAIALLLDESLIEKSDFLSSVYIMIGEPDRQDMIIFGMLFLVIVYLVKNSYMAFLAWKQAKYVIGIQAELSQRLFSRYLHQPYTFHLQRNSSVLMRNVMGEVSIFATQALYPVMLVITEVFVTLGLASLLLFIEPVGTIIIFITYSIACFIFYSITRKHVLNWAKERQLYDGQRIQHLQQGLSGAKEMKLLGREIEFIEQYSKTNSLSANIGKKQQTIQQLPRLWLEFLAVTGLAVLVITMIVQNQTTETILPTLAVFAAAAFRIMPSVNRMMTSIQSIRFSLPVIDNLQSEISLPEPDKISVQLDNFSFKNNIRLNHVYYTYPQAYDASLNGIDLEIKHGEITGFVGPSGAGKSTLVDVFLGLLEPQSGQVMVDGVDVHQNLRQWQNKIGYVPQSIYLTDDTIYKNIAFGLPEDQIEPESVNKALIAANLDEFINKLPEGMNTVVGEHGVRLSGGQLQRIGIARALYHNPEVLVLDEATSALDSDTEKEIMRSVTNLKGDKTIIIVTHRLSTVSDCYALFRLENGKLVDNVKIYND